MRFNVYGPYDIGVEKNHAGWIDKEDIDGFWEKIRRDNTGDESDLQDACGVYLFGMRGEQGREEMAGKTLPWYVGKAEKQNFKGECFSFKNLYYFNSILTNEYEGHGTPILYLLARVGEDGKPSPPAKEESYWGVRFVEEMFIEMSLRANPQLLNKSMTKMIRETSIPGFLDTGKHESSIVDELKGMFGINLEPAEVVKDAETKFRYEVDGLYPIPMKKHNKVQERTIDAERIQEIWSKQKNPLNDACGVYVIGVQYGSNTTPWYVGTAYQGFEKKCFKSDAEREKVVRKQRGTPVIYFLPRWMRKKVGFDLAKPTKNKPADMDYVQRVLLEYGVQTNEDILFEDPEHNARILRDLYVEGFVKSKHVKSKQGRRSPAVKELQSLLERR